MSKSSRAANGAGYIRKRSDGRWEGQYSAGYDDKTGKLMGQSPFLWDAGKGIEQMN